MSEFLKSAMGYFQNPTSDNTENSFVGQVVDVGAIRLRVKRIIAEGMITTTRFILCDGV